MGTFLRSLELVDATNEEDTMFPSPQERKALDRMQRDLWSGIDPKQFGLEMQRNQESQLELQEQQQGTIRKGKYYL